MSLDALDFLCHFLRESASRRLTIHILQEILQILIYTPLEPLRIQEYLRRPIPEFNLRLFHTPIAECIDALIQSKEIKGTDEDDVRLTQVIVVDALPEEIHVDHPLIVARPSWQLAVTPLRRLHFDVVNRSNLILNIDIETYGFAVQSYADALFRIRIANLTNLYFQDALQQPLAELHVLHDTLKDEVVLDGQSFPRL